MLWCFDVWVLCVLHDCHLAHSWILTITDTKRRKVLFYRKFLFFFGRLGFVLECFELKSLKWKKYRWFKCLFSRGKWKGENNCKFERGTREKQHQWTIQFRVQRWLAESFVLFGLCEKGEARQLTIWSRPVPHSCRRMQPRIKPNDRFWMSRIAPCNLQVPLSEERNITPQYCISTLSANEPHPPAVSPRWLSDLLQS